MNTLPKNHADDADAIVDLVLDEIDKEPAEIRDRLLAAVKAGEHQAAREPNRVIVYFPTVDRISYEVPIVPVRRGHLDA